MAEVVVQIIIWWAGAAAVLVALAWITFAATLVIREAASLAGSRVSSIIRLSTIRYWASRMEREGLTVMATEYRRMVAERKPKTIQELETIDYETRERINAE